MKTVRIILSVLLLVVFVVAMGISSLIFFIDPNKLKPVIAEQVQKNTGYGVQMDGRFVWSFYPHLGIKVDRLLLFAPKQPLPFIDMQNVIFITELKALLHGEQTLRGDIYIESVKFASTQATHAHVGLNWHDHILTLSPIKALLYGGTVNGTADGSELAEMPRWNWSMQFKAVQLKSLLQDIYGADSRLLLAGTGNLTFEAQSLGKSREQILNNLNGAFVYNIINGNVEGMDLNYYVQSAEAIIQHQPLNNPTNLGLTSFQSLIGAATIKNGIAEMNTLTLTSPIFIARAHGMVNLPYQAVNLQILVTSQDAAKKNWAIPVMLTGSIAKPDIRLDTAELNMMATKQQIEAAKSKLRELAKQHLSSDSQEALDKVLTH